MTAAPMARAPNGPPQRTASGRAGALTALIAGAAGGLLGCLLVLLYLAIPRGDGGEPYSGLSALPAAGLALLVAGALAITGGVWLLTGRRHGPLLTVLAALLSVAAIAVGVALSADDAAIYVIIGMPCAVAFAVAAALGAAGSSTGDPAAEVVESPRT